MASADRARPVKYEFRLKTPGSAHRITAADTFLCESSSIPYSLPGCRDHLRTNGAPTMSVRPDRFPRLARHSTQGDSHKKGEESESVLLESTTVRLIQGFEIAEYEIKMEV